MSSCKGRVVFLFSFSADNQSKGKVNYGVESPPSLSVSDMLPLKENKKPPTGSY